MPVRPPPDCTVCGKRIAGWVGRGTRPRYCLDTNECRRSGREKDRTCQRCGTNLRNPKPAQRFCKKCRWGCKRCGSPLSPKKKGDHTRDTYCSRDCRDAAWAGVALPICYFCKEPVELPVGGRSRKDPPKAHRSCYKKHNKELEEED